MGRDRKVNDTIATYKREKASKQSKFFINLLFLKTQLF
jgi:hypothetical protein